MNTELWRRFVAKLVGQTESGDVRWSAGYTPEGRAYCTCTVLDRSLCFWPDQGGVYVMADALPRFHIPLSDEETESLTRAIKARLGPAVTERSLAFAREYLAQGLT